MSDKTVTIDQALAILGEAKQRIGGDKCLVLCLESSDREDANVNELRVVDERPEGGDSTFVQVLVRHPSLIAVDLPTSTREEQIFSDAVDGLREFYMPLHDPSFVSTARSRISVPDTGNDQKDYEAVRDAIEEFLRKNRQLNVIGLNLTGNKS